MALKQQLPNLKLRYRNSFIDVDEDMEGTSKVRASSTPPALSRTAADATEEDDLRFYVETLSQKLQVENTENEEADVSPCPSTNEGTPMSLDYNTASEDEGPFPPEGRLRILPSTGSLGHPEAKEVSVGQILLVCRRPCIYFLAGHCVNGEDCTYCHLPHIEKTPKLDKRQRTIMQGLSRRELLALVLHFCRLKAHQAGIQNEAQEVLSLMEEEAASPSALPASISERDVRNLHKTLARMNFSNLIGLVTHQSPSRAKQTPASAERLSQALERLRSHFLPSDA